MRPIRLAFIAFLTSLFILSGCSDSDNTSSKINSDAPATPGDAEVLAKTGFGETLFDSAENKCQYCHSDIYNMWDQSAHKISWTNPIFQTNYQGVLRLQMNQIDTSKTEPGLGYLTTGQFSKGASKFCIKCHAPQGFYSSDHQVVVTEIETDTTLYDDATEFAALKAANESNLAGPNFDPAALAEVVSVTKNGTLIKASYQIGHAHNREGISCAVCHSIETIHMKEAGDTYTLKAPIKKGAAGPTLVDAGTALNYSTDGENLEMNAFFRHAGPEKYTDLGNTPKSDFITDKQADGRFTFKSITEDKYTGGPYYGPNGTAHTSNNRSDDDTDRGALAIDTPPSHYKGDGKALCLNCHMCAVGTINVEHNGVPGEQLTEPRDGFITGCVMWQTNSGFDSAANNTDTAESPACIHCHMEEVINKTKVHDWNKQPGVGTQAVGSHAFMATNKAAYGIGKLQSAVDTSLSASGAVGSDITVTTSIENQTGHMFPGSMPMRRALMRVVATDAEGTRLNYTGATGNSTFADITYTVATLPGETVEPGHETVTRVASTTPITFTGNVASLDGSAVSSQEFKSGTTPWTTSHYSSIQNATPTLQGNGAWRFEGDAPIRTISDSAETDHFTRIYGYQQVKDNGSGTLVVRPGGDAHAVRSTSLVPNEKETYSITFDASAAVSPVTVTYKIYYLKKGANAQFPTVADGFLDPDASPSLAITEIFSDTVQVTDQVSNQVK